jgi:hypothetical protein
MAKFTAGPTVGQVSGSVGGLTFSHNRGGQYMRRRAVPVTSTTPAALAAKATLADATAAFQSLTANQRLAWKEWALSNPVTDSLGQRITLTGHAAYVGNRARMVRAALTPLTSPPTDPTPPAFLTVTQTTDIGLGTTELAFTATPLGATERLWLEAAVTNSAAINYIQNLKRLCVVTAAALVSPYDYLAAVETVFGTLVVGQQVILLASVFDGATGLLSPPRRTSGTVIST